MTLPSARVVALTAAALVLAGGLCAGGWWWYRNEQHKVQAAWGEIETRLIAARGPQATAEQRSTAITQIEQFLQVHRSSGLTPLAAYDLGNLRFANGQYGGARVAYELALARGPSPTIRTMARSQFAASWEAERDFAKAADLYQALLADLQPKDFLFEQTLLDLARVQALAGRRDQAVAAYQRLLKDLPASPRADEVRARLADLAGRS